MTAGKNLFPSFMVAIVAFGILAVLLATAPQNALGFWPGIMVGMIACTAWRTFRTQPSFIQAKRRARVASVFLLAGLALALSHQRDIPTAAPFGILVALAVSLAWDRMRLA